MSQLELLPEDHHEPEDLCAAIRERRGGKLLKLDRMLLHSPNLAMGWNAYLGQVRQGLSLDPKLREMAMCGVAVLNGADYEFEQHEPVYLKAGASPEQAQALRGIKEHELPKDLFSELELDAMALIRAMTVDVAVPEELRAKLLSQMGSQALVELIAVTATYNMVSRFLVATGIHSEAQSQ